MKKLIAIVMFTMFAIVSGASRATVTTHEAPAVSALAASGTVETGPTTNVFDPVCTPPYVACTIECQDLFGSAKAACLRICRAEFQECLDN